MVLSSIKGAKYQSNLMDHNDKSQKIETKSYEIRKYLTIMLTCFIKNNNFIPSFNNNPKRTINPRTQPTVNFVKKKTKSHLKTHKNPYKNNRHMKKKQFCSQKSLNQWIKLWANVHFKYFQNPSTQNFFSIILKKP